jgi:para-nitrobenzyl esterase
MNRRSFLINASVFSASLRRATAEGRTSPAVATRSGNVRGRIVDGVFAFKGIPYGAPTGGFNRFLAPKKPAPWTGIRDAFEWGPCAPQSTRPRGPKQHAFFASLEPDPSVTASEDCLNLNVWTRGVNDGRKRPVMVWIHGGGYDQWSANAAGYDGASLARLHDVVLVSVNHRLGVLGYLFLESTDAFQPAANPGQLDLVAALEWVRDNIASYGGDPHRVTIFGQSGGARKISMLLGMPAAKGLFHRAAIESGATLTTTSTDAATRATRIVLDRCRIPPREAAKLQQVTVPQLIAAAAGTALAPVIDGRVLPANPFDPVASPLSADVPIIVGYTRTERTVYDIDSPSYAVLDADGLRSRTRALLGDAAELVIDLYRARYPKATPFELATNIATDVAAIPSIRLAERHAALGKAPTYLYVFAWETPVLRLRSPHTLEIPFVFHHIDRSVNMVGPVTRPIRALEAACAGAWTELARTGNPNHSGMPDWPAYTPALRATMLFDTPCRVENDPIQDVRKVLDATSIAGNRSTLA